MNNFESIYATVELIIFTYHQNQVKVFLQKNTDKAIKGKWMLPVMPIKSKDSIEKSIKKLAEKHSDLELSSGWYITPFSDPSRFPKKRVISFPMVMFSSSEKVEDASIDQQWISLQFISGIALDHKEMIQQAFSSFKFHSFSPEFVFKMLPQRFTLTQLQECMETIYETKLDKRNFRKRILQSEVVKPTKSKEKNVSHKAALLYTLNTKALKKFDF